jgi:hypothetical protein
MRVPKIVEAQVAEAGVAQRALVAAVQRRATPGGGRPVASGAEIGIEAESEALVD